MKNSVPATRLMATFLSGGLLLSACGKEQQPAAPAVQSPPVQAPQQVQQVQQAAPVEAMPVTPVGTEMQAAPEVIYGPEAMESLLAPVALYPDPVLAQVLATSTNPQEVLDAGNWLLENPDLTGADLEAAALAAAFTPPMVALVQFPTVVDMMCMEMDWTTELGNAFLADEPGVLDAVQRLRKQAADMGNLQSSEQMSVTTETQNNQEVIIVEPAQPEVVYVPQYDPAAVYTTAPTATATATATTTQPTQTVTTTEESSGHSTGALITTGLLAFGAGILVNEVFSDDDDYYYPNYGYRGGRPYYPPPYRPRYGNGRYPAHGYNRPNNYKHSFNNNNIYVNTGNKNYFNQFDRSKNNYRKNPKSPVTAARPNRPELNSLNQRANTNARTATQRQAGDRQVQGSYAGANNKKAAAKRPTAAVKAPSGSYAGGKRASSQMSKPKTAGARDRGRVERTGSNSYAGANKAAAKPKSTSRPAAKTATTRKAPQKSPSGLHGVGGNGKAEQKASQRGRSSMSKSAKSAARSKGRSRGENKGKHQQRKRG